jgi:hypothetical protein
VERRHRDLSPLARAVYGAVSDEYGITHHNPYPQVPHGEVVSSFELDLMDWGIALGAAYAIARAERPFDATHDVCLEAVAAAEAAFRAWGGDDLFIGTNAFEKSRRVLAGEDSDAL